MENLSNLSLTAIGVSWVTVHLFGLWAAWMVRMQVGKRYETLAQGGFFTALLAVAITTVLGHFCCVEMWPLSAVTLALMVVMAITDLGSSEVKVYTLER